MVNPQSPLPRHPWDATAWAMATSGSRCCPSHIRTSARFPSRPPGRLLAVGPASTCPPHPLMHRQAASSIQESLLTVPLLEQTSLASIGPSSLDPAPRAPSPGPALPFPSTAPVLTPPREPCRCMTAQSPSPTCRSLPRRRLRSSPSSRNAPSQMRSRRESSRVTFTWIEQMSSISFPLLHNHHHHHHNHNYYYRKLPNDSLARLRAHFFT